MRFCLIVNTATRFNKHIDLAHVVKCVDLTVSRHLSGAADITGCDLTQGRLHAARPQHRARRLRVQPQQ